jgi:hypothetical protein
LFWQGAKIRRIEAELCRSGQATAPNAKLSKTEEESSVKALRLQVSHLRQQLGHVLRSETERGAASTNAAPVPAESTADSPALTQDATNAPPAFLSGLIGSTVKLSFEAQIARACERLGLDDKQEQSMRDAVARAFEKGKTDLERVLSGKARPDEVPTQEEWAYALEQELLSGLTPEQQTLYRKFKHEDLTSYSRLTANNELLALQGTLGLSSEQQDQMFAVIFDQTQNRLEAQPGQDPQRPRDPLEAARYDCDQRLEALRTVLTSDQIENYARLQNAYLQYWENILKKPTAQ